MRYRYVLLIAALMVLVAGPLIAQAEKAAPPPPSAVARAADVLAALNKSAYTAKRAIPASENIFIEDSKVIEAMFALARQQEGVGINAGQTVTVSKVLLLDKALHVFFADDKIALLILTKDNKSVDELTTNQLLELAKKGIAALFTARDVTRPVT